MAATPESSNEKLTEPHAARGVRLPALLRAIRARAGSSVVATNREHEAPLVSSR